jgi:2-dehydropantoate 2-reductase
MRFLVVGAGALGGYYGGMLLKGGAEVAFLVRPRRAAQLSERGLVVESAQGGIARPVKTVLAGSIDGRYDTVLLACKAYDLASAIEDVLPGLAADGAVLPILNGINHIDTLIARVGRERVLGGLGFINGELSPQGVITMRVVAPNHLSFGELSGARSPRVLEIQRAFAAGGVPNTVSSDIIAEMWAKFCLYSAVAVIATLTRARAGEIAASPAGAGFVAAAFAEVAAVVAAEGHPPPADHAAMVRGLYSTAGSAYRPSVLVDVEQQKRTEAEHTLGDLLRRAERHGIATPLLQAALCALQVHEARLRKGAS